MSQSRASFGGNLLDLADSNRVRGAVLLSERKKELGQFMTPAAIASFMAGLFLNDAGEEINLLDPGAGVGGLTAAYIEHLLNESNRPRKIHVDAFEIEPGLLPLLNHTLQSCASECEKKGINFTAARLDLVTFYSNAPVIIILPANIERSVLCWDSAFHDDNVTFDLRRIYAFMRIFKTTMPFCGGVDTLKFLPDLRGLCKN